MNDLFKKLNVLVKAGISDLLGEESPADRPRRRSLRPEQLGKDIDREIESLRKRINEALDYEGELQAKVHTVTDDVTRWDAQADEAVTAGNDSAARHAIDQMRGAQQRLVMAESDLHEHRVVTHELIERVNMLEAAVADARRADTEKASEAGQTSIQTAGQALSDVLREAREMIAGMGDLISTRQETQTPAEEKNEEVVEDDLARRRERLSKPK